MASATAVAMQPTHWLFLQLGNQRTSVELICRMDGSWVLLINVVEVNVWPHDCRAEFRRCTISDVGKFHGRRVHGFSVFLVVVSVQNEIDCKQPAKHRSSDSGN